jgi:hypothetical protein
MPYGIYTSQGKTRCIHYSVMHDGFERLETRSRLVHEIMTMHIDYVIIESGV